MTTMINRAVGADLPKQRKVKIPVNFRPTERRFAIIEAIREKLQLNNRTEALEAALDLAASVLKIG